MHSSVAVGIGDENAGVDALAPPYAACVRRAAFDLRRSRQLILQLDKEKGFPESLPELVKAEVCGHVYLLGVYMVEAKAQ